MTEPFASFIAAQRDGTVLTGRVVTEVPFGVFVEMAPEIHGLLPGAKIAEGTVVQVKILDVDVERQRISLVQA
ncbi:S1 RNA-binding domain-containing protein [Kibdelosporangium philippinense]|uniref:S1 RNA-binding domain-containing protein n=1 Tax=Kibdelosporangium philippinense TaxID=211113 RepID=A0ABS8ZPV8_9PSEU|nr:S1 RNA-binding domain-containing protein [Kibdelosporangium philippinense]MCE7009781.1 S1 RNA-binding domain-containing protein [Kibdelosporangium philippinense]